MTPLTRRRMARLWHWDAAMLLRCASLVSLLLALHGCAPGNGSDPVPVDEPDQGPAGGKVAMNLELEVSGPLEVVELRIEMASLDMLSDREPDEAARLPINGTVALENGFGDEVASAAPGAYSALLMTHLDDAPALTLVVRLAGIRITVEASVLPPVRVRCPATIDLPDGAGLAITGTLNLSGLDDLLTGRLFPPPIGATEISVTEQNNRDLVDDVVEMVAASWSLTCALQ